ncbi:hypothetical protein HY732_05180 [Candidatus Uhrbacteria bacterium]|nr:hypothetical protein [Candidatus Uhrbacteria bacterium]
MEFYTTPYMKNISGIQQGIALDIDDTLSWTCREWVDHIFREFGNPENLSKGEFAKKYHLVQNAQYFQRDDVLARCMQFCYDERYYQELPSIEDALPAINEISRIIPIVAYLTTRPELLRKITDEWLVRHNFPAVPLIMNPHEFSHGITATWKSKALEERYPMILGIIDDNPSICEGLSSEYRGTVFLYGHGDADVPHPRSIACSDWNDVAKKITEHYLCQSSERVK